MLICVLLSLIKLLDLIDCTYEIQLAVHIKWLFALITELARCISLYPRDMFASELVITAASSVMALPPTPTQDCLSDVEVADASLSVFVVPSAVFPSSVGSRQYQDHWLSVLP